MTEEQRRSWAYGNTNIDNPNVTREMVDAAADKLTGIPVIDRLDAKIGDWEQIPGAALEKGELMTLGRVLRDTYPDLRALVLRLQAERDSETRRAETLESAGDQVHKQLLATIGERDALLEALKEMLYLSEYHYGPSGGWHDDEITDEQWCRTCTALRNGRAALPDDANVEGEDG